MPIDPEEAQYEITNGFRLTVYDRLLVAVVIWSPLDGGLQIIAKCDVVQFRKECSARTFSDHTNYTSLIQVVIWSIVEDRLVLNAPAQTDANE